jgi:hypothetical protein
MVFIEYASNGGSFKNGIDGPVRAHSVDYQTFLKNSTACPTGSTTQFTVTNVSSQENHIPLVGLSDEEVALFAGVNLPAGTSAVTSAELANVAQFSMYENVFGVAINSALAGQKTNFTHAELTSIFSGSYTDWSQLADASGNRLPAGPITIIDHPAGSGAKAAVNQYFLGNPGSVATAGALSPVNGAFGSCGLPASQGTGSYSANTYSFCLQSSDGNVVNGLNNSNSAGVRALGILSMEFQPGVSERYQFAALDGVSVSGISAKTCGNSVANAFQPPKVVSGAYDFFFTNSVQYRIKSVGGQPFMGDRSPASDFLTAFVSVATDPATDVSVPGVLLDPSNVGGPAGFPWDSCITKGTHNGTSTQPVLLEF